MKKPILLSFLLIIIFIITFYIFTYLAPSKSNTVEVLIKDNPFILEKALTPKQKASGLMNRDFLPEENGMIFIFEDSQKRGFWMKNTLIPLDMIFLDSNGMVVDINQDAQPCTLESECIPYISAAPAKYVIEINAGLAEKLGLEKGDMISLEF
jgi:hypothetical protein